MKGKKPSEIWLFSDLFILYFFKPGSMHRFHVWRFRFHGYFLSLNHSCFLRLVSLNFSRPELGETENSRLAVNFYWMMAFSIVLPIILVAIASIIYPSLLCNKTQSSAEIGNIYMILYYSILISSIIWSLGRFCLVKRKN